MMTNNKKNSDHEPNVNETLEEAMDRVEKTRESKWEFLKHPLLILFVGAVLSGILIPIYQNNQAKIVESTKAKYSLIEEVILTTSKVLASAENVVYLHQKPIVFKDQIMQTIKTYNTNAENFDSNFIKIKYNLKTILKDEKALTKWTETKKAINDLNNSLENLGYFRTDMVSFKHSETIKDCLEKIILIKELLDRISGYMIQSIER